MKFPADYSVDALRGRSKPSVSDVRKTSARMLTFLVAKAKEREAAGNTKAAGMTWHDAAVLAALIDEYAKASLV